MNMMHALPRVIAVVEHEPIPARSNPELPRSALAGENHLPEQLGVGLRRLVDPRDVLFGYDEDMHPRLRMDVLNATTSGVSNTTSAGIFFGGDLAKQAHGWWGECTKHWYPCVR